MNHVLQVPPSHATMRLKSAQQKLKFLIAKGIQKKLYSKLQPQMPLHVSAQLRIIKLSRFRKNTFYVKLTTFSAAQGTKNETKLIVDLKSKSKINMRSPRTVFQILLMSAVICISDILHENEIIQYLKNYKGHTIHQGRLTQISENKPKIISIGAPITKKRPFKKLKILSFLASFISKIKTAYIFNFPSVKYFGKGLLFLKF